MRINCISNINFQKKLMARCAVKKGNRKKFCNIYELEHKEDANYFKKLLKNSNEWHRASFIPIFDDEINNHNTPYKIYVLEDLSSKCLGICSVDKGYSDKDAISILEVIPKYAHKNKGREIKYIGETLVTFLAKMAQKEGKSSLDAFYILDEARGFYIDRCHFEKKFYSRNAKLDYSEFNTLENQNYEHTKSRICIFDKF